MSARRVLLALLLAALADRATAAGGPVIRTRIAPASVAIGQPVTLAIDVLVPTWFGGAIDYPPTIAIPDTVAKLSDERPVNLNERIGDASYAGMTKNYVIVPQKAGAFEVPAFSIRVPYAVDGKTVVAEVRTAPQRFEARLPAGAADLGYFIATRSYRLVQQLDPVKLGALKVGDAVTRTITQRATDFAPMFLPALTFEPIAGLELYPAEPVLAETGGERGAARIATRTDAVTYVLAKAGRYRLPGLRIGWFDPGQAVMRWAEVPELAFEVAPNPALRPASAGDPRAMPVKAAPFALFGGRWREAVTLAIGVLLLGALSWRLVPPARRRLRDARRRRAASEAAAFRQLRSAIRGADASAIRGALTRWAELATPCGTGASLSRFADAPCAAALVVQTDALDRQLYAEPVPGAPNWSRKELERSVIAARKVSSGRRAAPPEELTQLNPRGTQ